MSAQRAPLPGYQRYLALESLSTSTVVEPIAPQQKTTSTSTNSPQPSNKSNLFRLSVALQYFRMKTNVEALSRWKACAGVELLVNVDSRDIGDLLWLNTSADRVVFSRNTHEIRAYNALARLARAPYVAFVQDDAAPPKGCSYLDVTERMMAADPRLGVIGWRTFTLFPYFHSWRGALPHQWWSFCF